MKVSVSVTTYRHERFIARTLDGILMQETDFDYEVVVGEDCSTDRTREIVLEYQRRFPDRVRTVFPERNLGDGGRRMFVETVRACRGELVAMTDGDDYWTAPDKLQRQVEFMEAHPECSMCFHNVLVVHEDGSRPPEPHNPPGQPAFSTMDDILWSCFVAACSPMIRREVIAELPAWYFAAPWGDHPLYLLAAERGRIGYIDAVMGVYRAHGGGLWSALDPVEQLRGSVRMYDALPREMRRRHRRTISRVLGWRHFQMAGIHADRGDVWQAGRCLLASLRHDPREARTGYRRLLRVARRALRTRVERLRGFAAPVQR